jgi:hypothetical protein
MTSYAGLDYSHGEPVNRDLETGIRYGVISQNEVCQAWADESQAVYPCKECEFEEGDDECSNAECEPAGFAYEEAGYVCASDSHGDIFVCKSLYFTYAQFCSPCAPGACHLENPLEWSDEPPLNNRAYCFGHDWFEGEVAPYPVYSVETGELAQPLTEHWDERFQNENMCWVTYAQVIEACGGEDFPMGNLSGAEADEITAAVNQGIDAHLEAVQCTHAWNSRGGLDITCTPEGLCVLLRRLFEADPCSSMGSSILYCLGFNDSGEFVGREALGLE